MALTVGNLLNDPLATSFTEVRKRSGVLSCGGSQAGIDSSNRSSRSCLAATCSPYGVGSWVQERQAPASKYVQRVSTGAARGTGAAEEVDIAPHCFTRTDCHRRQVTSHNSG